MSTLLVHKMVFECGSSDSLLTLLQHYSYSGQAPGDITLDVDKYVEHYQFLAYVCYNMVQWEKIGSYLGIEQSKLKRFEKGNEGTSEQAFQMLHYWATREEPALVTTLLSALERCSLRVNISNNGDAEMACLLVLFGHLHVTDEFLLKISLKIPSAWRFIGRFLGLSRPQLDTVEYMHRDRPQSEISYQMLLKWMKESDQATVNYKCLARALFLMYQLDSSSVCDAWSYTRRHLTNLTTP